MICGGGRGGGGLKSGVVLPLDVSGFTHFGVFLCPRAVCGCGGLRLRGKGVGVCGGMQSCGSVPLLTIAASALLASTPGGKGFVPSRLNEMRAGSSGCTYVFAL